jgi:prophage tail gpP-like protein
MTDWAGTGRVYTRDDAQITVTVGGVAYQGWLQSEVERSIETIAGTFSIPVSLDPGNPPAIKRQDEVTVQIGDTTVLTGFVLSAEPFYKRGDCGVRVVGRDRTGDLVRCSALYKGGQWLHASLTRIVKDLVTPFDLEVVVDADVGAPLVDFKLYHGETVLDAIARAARLRGVLVTRDSDGRVLLTKAGKERFRGVIARGVNVIEMQGVGTDEHRHSEYVVFGQGNVEITAGMTEDQMSLQFQNAHDMRESGKDAEIKRYSPLVIQADGNTTRAELKTLVEHTVKVRRGHALGIRYTVEGWTFEGEPWPINQRVQIFDDVVGLSGDEWLICSAKQTCDLREGDVTELLVRPVDAYDVVPLNSRPKPKKFGSEGPHDGAKTGGGRR